MTVPYIHPLVEVRAEIGHMIKAMAAGEHGPVLMGPYSLPAAALVSWDLFDHMRDLLSELDVLRTVPDLAARITHPSGASDAPLSALCPTSTSQLPVTFWPDVATDLRTTSTPALADAIEAVTTGGLPGQPLTDARLPGQWAWFHVPEPADRTQPRLAHSLVWRTLDQDTIELVAIIPASGPTIRAWQPAPDPEAQQAEA